MLIKLYTKDGSLHIIEGITDVSVPMSPSFGDYSLEPWQVFDFDRSPNDIGSPPKVIEYAKDGPCMLRVTNIAYIFTVFSGKDFTKEI